MNPFPARRGSKAYLEEESVACPTNGKKESILTSRCRNTTAPLKDLSDSAHARVTLWEHLPQLTLQEAGALQKTRN